MTETYPRDDDQWVCEAYGPAPAAFGWICFFAGKANKRVCVSQETCHEAMTAKRQQVFQRINERAACGDETAAFLAETFTDPGQLLAGGAAGEDL